jgi:uncharacterized protein DUF6281
MSGISRAVAMAAASLFLVAACGEDAGLDDPGQQVAVAAECSPGLRFGGTVYWGLISRSKHPPASGQIGVADVAACDDVGRNPIGPFFPPEPDQVEVWALEGYPTSEVIAVQRSDGLDVYANADMSRARADLTTAELTAPESKSPDTPRLLTSPEGPAVGMEALVSGVLRVNDAGCFALGHQILVAPPGSTVGSDGESIVIPQLGRFAIGDTIRGGGGQSDATNDVLDATCVPNNSPPLFVVLNQYERGGP